MKKFHLLILIFAFQFTKAKTWTTISYGYWNSPSVWLGGIAPPLSCSDTFNIKHAVAIFNNVVFNSGSLLNIDTTGGICGHNNVSIKSGAKFYLRGIFQVDTLFVPGGKVYMYSPGSVTLTCSGIISNGGSMTISGASLVVGPWFNCRNPEYQFTGIEELSDKTEIKLFPNPASQKLNILTENGSENSEIIVINCLCEEILKIPFTNSVDVSKLSAGFYYLRIASQNKEIYYAKFIKD
jgi:hypothetical protein